MYKFSTSVVKTILLCLVFGAVPASPALAQQEFSIQSDTLQQTREIVVYLPENYDPENTQGYPVLYMLDADHHDDEIAAQTARELHNAGTMPEVIVIALKNISRGLDFLPHHTTSAELNGERVYGNGGKLLAYIKNELIPFANNQFKTSDRRLFAGHSWAGQFVAYSLSQFPDLFDGYFITSPSIGEYGDKTYDDLTRVFKQDLDFPAFVYVSVGSSEEPDLLTDYDRLTAILKQHLPAHTQFQLEVNEGATHDNNGSISVPTAMKLYFSKPFQ